MTGHNTRTPEGRAALSRARRIHGMEGTPTYRSWDAMLQRCTNPNANKYPNYGGRGIAVCDLWRHSFTAFLEDMGKRPEGMTLDRIDPDGDYEPANCRWLDAAENSSRRRPAGTLTA